MIYNFKQIAIKLKKIISGNKENLINKYPLYSKIKNVDELNLGQYELILRVLNDMFHDILINSNSKIKFLNGIFSTKLIKGKIVKKENLKNIESSIKIWGEKKIKYKESYVKKKKRKKKIKYLK